MHISGKTQVMLFALFCIRAQFLKPRSPTVWLLSFSEIWSPGMRAPASLPIQGRQDEGFRQAIGASPAHYRHISTQLSPSVHQASSRRQGARQRSERSPAWAAGLPPAPRPRGTAAAAAALAYSNVW